MGICLLTAGASAGFAVPPSARIGKAAAPKPAALPADAVVKAPPASWVDTPPAMPEIPSGNEASIAIRYFDTQLRVLPDGTEEAYVAYRSKILKPEGLAAGNITLTWQPESGTATIHHLHLIRDGRTIDVLASTDFTVLRREADLDRSMLNGQRTATLQVPGLQVGDEIAVAATVTRREPAFAGRSASLFQMPVIGTPGAFRYRGLWPKGHDMAVARTRDMAAPRDIEVGAFKGVEYLLLNPVGIAAPEGAPVRYAMRRLIEQSDFGGWADLSRNLAPVFERAATLPPGSPIRSEAAAIAARTKDPVERAEAALQIVEDRIRYVFLALDGGNYKPATAEETWTRRFGDCKAKTVLLTALLRELGIEARPALVNAAGGDGLDERLPGMGLFDHVVVRAVVAGRTEWLDATRLGDRRLDNVVPPFRWALPLSVPGSGLERIVPRDTGFPSLIGLADIDATAGSDRDARVTIRNILRGDEALATRANIAALPPAEADRVLKSFWRQQADWITPEKVSWSYDERRAALTLAIVGTGRPEWKGDEASGHRLDIVGAGFFPPDYRRRPADQDQAAPWFVAFPRYRCWATTIRLPASGRKFAWSLYADPMNRRLGGIAYWRAAGMTGNIVRTVMSTRAYEAEASPQEADVVNRAIPGFNNNMSNVSEEARGSAEVRRTSHVAPFDEATDWINAPAPCSPAS